MANNKRTSKEKEKDAKRTTKASGTGKTEPIKSVPAGSKGKKTGGETGAERAVRATAVEKSGVPARAICASAALLVFVLLLVIFLKPDGAMLRVIQAGALGLVGQVGFFVAIPISLYIFAILAFSGRRPVVMRCVSAVVFNLLCGCFSHLILNPQDLPTGIALIGALYNGGIAGTTGGVICGLIGTFLRWLCGSIFSYVVLVVAMAIFLLASMQITIPGIIRAVRNRPQPEDEEEAPEPELVEPATVVVNHIANKQMEYSRKQRSRKAARAQAAQPQESSRDTTWESDFASQLNEDPTAPIGGFVPQEAEISSPLPEIVVEPAPAAPPVLEEPSVVAPEQPPKRVTPKEAAQAQAEVAQEIAAGAATEIPMYRQPSIELLRRPPKSAVDGTEEMRENSQRLNETLSSFKIEAHIVNVTRGPSVTRYEVELEKGVRLNKLTSCADDIALSLGASGVRIAAVPGKISVVGIEVPNRTVTTVSLREVVDAPEFQKAKSKSAFAVGKDISGNCIVGDIARLPHMLIAGTTGSGKSVCMNSIIISLLYKAKPEEVRLIMVDPKMVELGIYNGIPHLLIPVVTDPKKAAGSLQWAVMEMMRRYQAMSEAGVRDLESYNSIVDSQELEGERLPQVVVIIDELADLMLVAAKEVEESICRIAQMGRAAGIHLIIATQRPSADVITGLMKANIPSRIAFAVASAMESRIILDTAGAEKLVGRGDMLYAPMGCGKPMRVQGCFVTDGEVEAVANYIKENYTTSYDQEVMEEIDRKAEQTGTKGADPDAEPELLDGDELLPAAVDVILETGQASVSMLQRRLKLGYARAARIVDEMEERGVVGPFQGSKPREILITREQWQAMNGQSSQMAFSDLSEESPVETGEE